MGGLFFDLKPWLWMGLGTLALSVLIWIPFILGITRYLRQMTKTTEAIAAGRFDRIIRDDRSDELGQLGRAINRMSRRLAGYMKGQKRFLGDISHELCSPIARARMGLGVLEQRLPEARQAEVADIEDELEHMSQMVNELLAFSRERLGEQNFKLESVNVYQTAQEALKRETGPTEEIKVEEAIPTYVLADKDLLKRAIGNVVRNAMRYAGADGAITISSETVEDDVCIKIADSGPGVPESALDRIFDPFFRPEAARTPGTGGVGLGLAIVKNGIESCGGVVTCQNLAAGGFEVSLTLQRAEPPEGGEDSKPGLS